MTRAALDPRRISVDSLHGTGAGVVDLDGVALPVAWRVAGEGPRVLVVGGTHGDEFEGQLAAGRLAERLPSLGTAGTIVVLPRHNAPACAAGTRRGPADAVDINRIYPCTGGDGPSAAIARFVTALLPGFDWLIDLHSGGTETEFVLSSNLQARPGSAEERAMRPFLEAFGAPYAIVFDETEGGMPHGGTLEGAARALGIRAISSELGGGGRLTAASAACAVHGLMDLLVAIGSLDARHRSGRTAATTFLRLDRPEHHVLAPAAGMLEPLVPLGAAVAAGEPVAVLHGADGAATLTACCTGTVVALPARALVRAGDTVVYVAEPL